MTSIPRYQKRSAQYFFTKWIKWRGCREFFFNKGCSYKSRSLWVSEKCNVHIWGAIKVYKIHKNNINVYQTCRSKDWKTHLFWLYKPFQHSLFSLFALKDNLLFILKKMKPLLKLRIVKKRVLMEKCHFIVWTQFVT